MVIQILCDKRGHLSIYGSVGANRDSPLRWGFINNFDNSMDMIWYNHKLIQIYIVTNGFCFKPLIRFPNKYSFPPANRILKLPVLVKSIFIPIHRIVFDVFPDVKQRFFISDDVIIIIALPNFGPRCFTD